MFAPRSRAAVVTAAALALEPAATARAEEPVEPALNYVVAGFGTTLLYQPPHGAASGLRHDLSPSVGYGRYFTGSVGLELDIGPSFTRGHYTGFALATSVVWGFASHFYAAGHVVEVVDPELGIVLASGVGAFQALSSNLSLTLELDVGSTIAPGDLDLSLTATSSLLYAF